MSPRRPHVTAVPFLEDLVFTGLSMIVLTALVAGVFMQPTTTIAFAAAKPGGGGGGGGPNSQFEILYGAITDSTGKPVVATISVEAPSKIVTIVQTGADGTFRIRFKDVGGPYKVTVTCVVNGQTITDSKVIDMQPGYSYGLNAQVRTQVPFFWVALPIY